MMQIYKKILNKANMHKKEMPEYIDIQAFIILIIYVKLSKLVNVPCCQAIDSDMTIVTIIY